MDGKAALFASCAIVVVLAVLCRFRNPVLFKWNPVEDTSLGKAGEGTHKDRMLGVAVHDMMFTILLALVLASLSRGPFTFWFIVVLILGEVLHAAFGVRSPTFKWLFVERPPQILTTNLTQSLMLLVATGIIGASIFS